MTRNPTSRSCVCPQTHRLPIELQCMDFEPPHGIVKTHRIAKGIKLT